MRVLILHDQLPADARADALEVLEQAAAIEAALVRAGHVVALAAFEGEATRRRLAAAAPEVVFNLVETVEGVSHRVDAVPAMLASLGLPYTGCRAIPMRAATGKLFAKELLVAAGLPTPAWHALAGLHRMRRIGEGAWIVKSVWEHGSLGLETDSVIRTGDGGQLAREIEARLASLGGMGYAEAYVDGREFNLAILQVDGAPQVLAPAEIEFRNWPAGLPRVVGWRAKWATQSAEYAGTVRRQDFDARDGKLLAQLAAMALRCWRLFGLSGYARVDFRVDEEGCPWVLEVNANPSLAPDAGFAAAAARSGLSYDDLVRILLAAAHAA